jgi:tRNA (guanosine-2'-O-)-methyltransferase
VSGGGPNYEKFEGKPAPEDLLLPQRIARLDEVLKFRTRSLTVVLDRLEDTFNMAAVLRTCEAMGVQEVHVVQNREHPWSPNSRVTQGCDKWLDIELHKDFGACKKVLKARGYKLLASAIREDATSIYKLEFKEKIALIFGNERFGCSQDVLDGCDGTFWLPMKGFTQSLNISAAASACITRAMSWRWEHLGEQGDLTPAELTALRDKFMFLSVRQRGRLYGRKK